MESLDPCCNGIPLNLAEVIFERCLATVLILVVMEYL